jgi:hypothetical protein
MRMRPAAMTARTAVQPPACTRIVNGPEEPCDCTVHCGDDPRLQRGQAKACPAKVERERLAAETTRRMELQRSIADTAALTLVRYRPRAAWANACEWFDCTPSPRPTQSDLAIEYLLLRRLAERHPQHPHLVRICPAAPRPTPETTTP